MTAKISWNTLFASDPRINQNGKPSQAATPPQVQGKQDNDTSIDERIKRKAMKKWHHWSGPRFENKVGIEIRRPIYRKEPHLTIK